MREEMSVRQWQEKFRAGDFNSQDRYVQCQAGWYDWFCRDHALAGRLKKIGKVVMGITGTFILDNYYVWFKNNCPMVGPLYDDVRFEPLSGERGGDYFVVSLDSPYEQGKWALYTERFGFDAPEFECADVREMTKYINGIARELELKTEPDFVLEKRAAAAYFAKWDGEKPVYVRREDEHTYTCRSQIDRRTWTVQVSSSPEQAPPGFDIDKAEKISGLYVYSADAPEQPRQVETRQKPPRKKEAAR